MTKFAVILVDGAVFEFYSLQRAVTFQAQKKGSVLCYV
jgi:hypothetical protein